MKRILIILSAILLVLCGCAGNINTSTDSISSDDKCDAAIVGKWIDVKTEKIHEYTADGFYYEYVNESFTSDKTRYITQDGKIYYYLDGDEPDTATGIDYEIKDGHLFIAGILEYKPMDIKTSLEEME